MSGAGKSVALKTLEDGGYEVVDNIPPSLLPALLKDRDAVSPALAVVTDVRSRFFSAETCLQAIEAVKQQGRDRFCLVFLDCDDETLRRRFTETRRRHPLAQDRSVLDGMAIERTLLAPLRLVADMVIDTTDFDANDLRRHIQNRILENPQTLSLFVTSFSYREGIPREADLVFDVRFLQNPHYMPKLKDRTGLDEDVGRYVAADKDFGAFFERLTGFLLPLLPRYTEEGKRYLTVAVGCTGGKHRSVFVSEKLAGFLKSKGYNVEVRHRDMQE